MTGGNELFCEVILPLHLPQSYTYRVPEDLKTQIQVGCRVAVQFGKKRLYSGIVTELHNRVPRVMVVKYILELLDFEPIVSKDNLDFWQWIADYYACYIGDVLVAALPSAFRLKSESKILVSPDFSGEADDLSEEEIAILKFVEKKKNTDINSIATAMRNVRILPVVENLIKRQILACDEQLYDRYSPKFEDYLTFGENCSSKEQLKLWIKELESKKASALQLEALMSFVAQKNSDGFVKKADLQNKVSQSSINTLIRKGVLKIEPLAFSRLQEGKSERRVEEINLNSEQQKAFEGIISRWNDNPISLLFGVTGSGKTEVYIKLIDHVVKQGKQVLFLLPEIALSAQLLGRLETYFGNKIGIYHSRFSKDERAEIWNKVKNPEKDKSYRIIIGSRSAIFLPFTDLGLVIVDEEHDAGFKQTEPAPRYNAKDAALYLAHTKGTKVVLGSATPSIETYFNTETGRFNRFELHNRYTQSPLPQVQIVNLKDYMQQGLMYSVFSEPLFEEINRTLAENRQVILFKNLRGFASNLRCEVCGWTARCPNCDVTLTVHKHTGVLNCHYCGYTSPIVNECPECHSHLLRMVGSGSEKIEAEAQKYFPDAKVARLDLDTTRQKSSYTKIIEDFAKGKTNILCGTQLVSKGLDFDKVGLVGVVDADSMLFYPDFRAYERCFDMLTQVAGRSGRGDKVGKVIIQTYNPLHQIFQEVANHNYRNMYNAQIVERKLFRYPPFYHLVKINLQSKDINLLNEFADTYAMKIRGIFGGRILGPEFPAVSKIRNLFIKTIILKLERTVSYAKAKQAIMRLNEEMLASPSGKQMRIITDVDPQ